MALVIENLEVKDVKRLEIYFEKVQAARTKGWVVGFLNFPCIISLLCDGIAYSAS